MKIFIDVSNLLSVNFLTGIQRVVREVVLRMLNYKSEEYSVVLLSFNETNNIYEKVDNEAFFDFYSKGIGNKEQLLKGMKVQLEDFNPGDVFFDIDSVWNLSLRRSVLLPKLKENGVKIAVFIHDIIPITHPQFCHGETVFKFMNYIGAYLQYADLIISSAQSTLDAIAELLNQLKLPQIKSVASWLGSDFKLNEVKDEEVHPDAIKAVESGKYVLMVGTIEPRKNHSLVLDAFDNFLFKKGINLIFAGGIGWNVEEFQKRMENHPRRNKQFYHLKGMNDATIDYLYKHAYCVAFPTYNEGFGLPVIESIQRGTPVLASDIPVMREVGGDYCAYFKLDSWEDFSEKLLTLIENEQEYSKLKERLKNFETVSWDTVSRTMWDALISLKEDYPYEVPNVVKQMVYLTARKDDLMKTLPFVESFMPFIKEVVLCCPDNLMDEVQKEYQGQLQIKYLTDTMLLAGNKLPEDHTMRNFFLRCLAIQQDVIDDVFIMSDDDYRPLHPITQDVFLQNGKYCAYYCYHLEQWKGNQGELTSFDESMHRTYDFLKEHKLTTWMYDSHMPQVIDKRVFADMLRQYPGIENHGYSDWSMYFNYMNTLYPNQIDNRIYVSLAWPGNVSDWDTQMFPEKLLFENFYDELYQTGEIFEGLSKQFYEGIAYENAEKVVRYMHAHAEHNHARTMYSAYCENYEMLYGERPYFSVAIQEDNCTITLPEYVAIAEIELTRIPIYLDIEGELVEGMEINYRFIDVQNKEFAKGAAMRVDGLNKNIDLPVKGVLGGFKGVFEISVKLRGKEYTKRTLLCVMKKGV